MLLWAIVYFVFGSVLMIHWGLAMFTDTGPGEFAREISAEMGVKNNLALRDRLRLHIGVFLAGHAGEFPADQPASVDVSGVARGVAAPASA